jgi:acetoin utilization deacetylase AcuC-like enzyme
VSDTQKFITSLILVNVGFDFAGADRIVMFKVSVKFYWQLQGYIYCSKLLVLWLFVFLDALSTACLE